MLVKYLKAFIGIAAALTLVIIVLGSVIVRDILPTWVMLIVNPPFGIVYVWTESLWMGEGYSIGEKAVSAWQWGAYSSQIFLYFGLWFVWDRYRRKPEQHRKNNQSGKQQS